MSSSTGEKKRKIGVDDASDELSDVVFEYKGNGQIVPKDVVSVRFDPSVIAVDDAAFKDCNKLQEVVFNVGLKQIGQSAFKACNSLQSIKFPSTVTEIGDCAFYACNSLREVVLNDGIKEFGYSVFAFCTPLQSITIPSTVDDICDFAFCSCRNLNEIVLNEGIQRIGRYTFHECSSLRSIKLPSAVVEIEQYAFSECTGLRDVIIHNEGVQIGDQSFYNCTSLERFKFPGLSTRLDNIIQAGQRGIEAKMDDIQAVEWRGEGLVIPIVRQEIENQWGGVNTLVEVDKEKLYKVDGLISYHEMKEATTLFELALWKARIGHEDTSNPSDHAAYRTEVPGPIKDTILQYLR